MMMMMILKDFYKAMFSIPWCCKMPCRGLDND